MSTRGQVARWSPDKLAPRPPIYGDDVAVRAAATDGSRRLLVALHGYFLNGGRG